MFLRTTSQSLKAVLGEAANITQPVFAVDYVDLATSPNVKLSDGAPNVGDFNDTMNITIVNAPSDDTLRQLKYLNVFNADDIPHEVSIIFDDGTQRPIHRRVLGAGKTLSWSPENRWSVPDSASQSSVIGALVTNSSNPSVNNATDSVLGFDTEVYDEGGFHSTSVNTGRLTVPYDVDFVELTANVTFDTNNTGYRQAFISKNGANFVGMPQERFQATQGAFTFVNLSSGRIAVSYGDYFELYVTQTSGGALDIIFDYATSWFCIRSAN